MLLPICYFVQEMVARLGIATGKGHAAMIYKRFGKWWGHFSLLDLLAVNFLTLITEFAAISLALSAMGVSPWISVPVSALGLTLMVVTGSYLRWERIVIALCLIDLTWFALAFVVHPDWATVTRATVVPTMPADGITSSLIFFVIAIVGTTIAPWQLFFQQSCVAEKRLRFSDLKWARLDTLIGAAFTVLVAGAMMLVGAYGNQHKVAFEDPAQLALALGPLAGNFVRNGVLLLMVNAAVLGTTAISLASAWAYGEVQGWEHSLHKKLWEAPGFYATYIQRVWARLQASCSYLMCRSNAGHPHQRAGLRWTDPSVSHHLPAVAAQRPRTARRSLGQPALEQLHQLDHHRGPLCPVAAACDAGDAAKAFWLRTRGDLWQP